MARAVESQDEGDVTPGVMSDTAGEADTGCGKSME